MSFSTISHGLHATPGLLRPAASPRFAVSQRRCFAQSATALKQRLVILGSGWAGYEAMRSVDRNRYDVVTVSANSYFTFTPLLASTAVGTLEFRCALEPVRRYGDQVVSYQAWCDKLDLEKKRLECLPSVGSSDKAILERKAIDKAPKEISEAPGVAPPVSSYPGLKPFTLSYDKLVIAVGAYSQTFNTPGVKEYAHFLKDVKDARRIRSRILEVFELAAQPTLTGVERAHLLHFVVVGGGPTGIEFAAELHDLLASDMLRHYPSLASIARITIYDVAPRILGGFDADLVKQATERFARQGVTIKNNHHVTRVNEASIEIEEEGTVPFGLLVWSTGLAPNPLIESIKDLQHDEKTHSLKVNDNLQPFGVDGKVKEDVWVLGDCSMMETPLPATAQVANQQAKHVAKHLNALVRNRDPPGPFKFVNQGLLTYTGDWTALFDRSGAESGPKAKESGRLAWLIWRSAYWSQALSWRNKACLAFYWFLNWIFGRSITRF